MLHEYITQEQAVALSKTIDWTFHPTHATELCNAAIQHYKDSLPKPTGVEEIEVLIEAYKQCTAPSSSERYVLIQTITQQAEALAQALAEVERLKREKSELEAPPFSEEACEILHSENRKLRAQLAALNDPVIYDGELPEPFAYLCDGVGIEKVVSNLVNLEKE